MKSKKSLEMNTLVVIILSIIIILVVAFFIAKSNPAMTRAISNLFGINLG